MKKLVQIGVMQFKDPITGDYTGKVNKLYIKADEPTKKNLITTVANEFISKFEKKNGG